MARLAAGSVLFGILVLASWRLGRWEWLALGDGYVPTAPGTGVMVILLGSALLLQALVPIHHAAQRLVIPLAVTVVALAVMFALVEPSGAALPVEYWFSRVATTRGGVPVGQTALATSALCAMVALGILLRQLRVESPRWQASLHLTVGIASLILLQGYLFGGPLMYGRGVIPVAALTAAVLLALSTASLVLAGPTHWPVRLFVVAPTEGSSPTMRDARWFVVLLIAFVALSGFFWAVAEGDRVQQLADGSVVRLAIRATVLSVLLAMGLGAALLAAWSRRDLAATSRELQLVQEREQSIEELRRSEERYALAMRGTSDGLWDWDLPSDAVYVSPHWVEMFDLTDTSNLTMTKEFFGRLHPDDQERAAARLQAHLQDGGPYSQEVRLRHDDGRYLWFWVRGEAQRDANGTPIRMAGAISDITARREAEDALLRTDRILRLRSAANLALVRAESEVGMLQEITQVAVREGGYRMAWVGRAEPDGEQRVRPVVVSGHVGEYLTTNPVTWSADDPRGAGPTGRCIRTGTVQAAQDLMAERHFAPWRAAAIAHGFAASCSIPLRRGDEMFGALMLYSAEPHAFDEAEIGLLTEIGNDVSFGLGALRDHQAVVEQRAELLLFRQVMERSSDAIFITDAVTGKFLTFNAAAPRWLGYTADELRAMGPSDIVPQVGGAPGWASVVGQIRAEDSVVWPRTFCRKDGTTFPVEVALTAINTGDREVILSIARDISEREQLMVQLLRSQKMESVGRLAGGVAHDFNNLLTVINATVDLAMPDAPPGTALQRDLEEIRGASNRAAALTRQLLAFSRQQVLHQEAIGLNDLIAGFLKLLRRVIGEDIAVQVELASTSPTVFADAGQLEQVLMNLSVNARDAMPDGGTLTIRTAAVHLQEQDAARHDTMRPGDYALIEVVDTGSGMDRKTQAMIFEPFFTTKAPGKGTGLGLSTVYGIIKQMGGGIWVSSEVGVGTTFKIYLPLVASARTVRHAPTSAQPTSGTETILVVEDEAAIRTVVRRVLERAGYTVLDAASGSEALELLGDLQGPLDLVITDLVMPGMSGAELAAELRRTRPGIRILMTSGYSADVVEGKIVPGVDFHFISKPYTAGELTGEVRRVLDLAAVDRSA